jgi:hypothetical protein
LCDSIAVGVLPDLKGGEAGIGAGECAGVVDVQRLELGKAGDKVGLGDRPTIGWGNDEEAGAGPDPAGTVFEIASTPIKVRRVLRFRGQIQAVSRNINYQRLFLCVAEIVATLTWICRSGRRRKR